MECVTFKQALPVWPKGRETEKNLHVGFRSVFSTSSAGRVMVRLTGSTMYRVFLNGEFVHHGPARGPHDFYRVDELDLSSQIVGGDNLLAIEVVGYNCNSFAYLNQSSFLQAEVLVDDKIAAATGGQGFDALHLSERVQKVERYSFQRPFVEAYQIAPGFDDWRKRIDIEFLALFQKTLPEKQLLPRGVALPGLPTKSAAPTNLFGSVAYAEKPVDRSSYWWMNDPRYYTSESFLPEQFERDLLQIWQACDFSGGSDGRWNIYDLGINLSGFIQMNVSCKEPVRLVAAFDELLIDGDIDLNRNTALNFVYYELQPGEYALESVDPYTFRYLKIIVLDGNAEICSAGIREYVNAEVVDNFKCSDPDLNKLFAAGVQTFRQNAIDLYMDCPGRERAGWLCDSFFTGRAEKLLCGNSRVEQNFLENFLLPESFTDIPDGMLPMCYPSEHPGGRHIPQWVMWLMLELEEYLERTGDREMIDRFESKVDGFLTYLEPFENSDGLLEKLPSWNFIEWSMANKLVDDVNYPTNMLYARSLESVGRLYARPELIQKAAALHETVRQQSFDGMFFVDNSVRDAQGVLQPSGECSEVCQYYAFFCGTATPETFFSLWTILLEELGPNRNPGGAYDRIHPANAFIGYYMRMDLLSRFGEGERLLDEMKRYFLGMTERTGTLWERDEERSSCNHGFASYLCVLIAEHASSEIDDERQELLAGCC